MTERDERAVPMEGRSRGPNIHSGGTQDVREPVPPYEGRSAGSEDIEKRGRMDHDAGAREVSEEEREGVHPADTAPGSPHGVGVSTSGQGNEMVDTKEEHRAERKEASQAGVGSSKPIDPESPDLAPGDQGG